MSMKERYGTRDLTFSGWHRTLPPDCTAIDIDFVEYCNKCKTPLALIEIARDVGQEFKATTILAALARRADIPAYLIIYKIDGGMIGNCKMARIFPDKTRLYNLSIADVGAKIIKLHRTCKTCASKDTAGFILKG